MSSPTSKGRTTPTEATAAAAANPQPASSPTPSAAAPPVFTHTITIYGAEIQTNLDHTQALLSYKPGVGSLFATVAGQEPSAFAAARDEAKQKWKAEQAAKAEAQKNRVQELIAKARSKGAK